MSDKERLLQPSEGLQEEAAERIDRLRGLFSDEKNAAVTRHWQNVTKAHSEELLADIQSGELLP